MLKKVNKSISGIDKVRILLFGLVKVIRGFLRKPFFRVSKGLLLIGKSVSILDAGYISVGANVKFEKNSEIQGLSINGVILGNNVTIGHSTMIRPSSYYGTGELGEGLLVGDNSSVGPYGYVGCAGFIRIGSNVMIGPRVSLFAENHNFSDMSVEIKSQGVNRKGIVIEDNCWIGGGVIVLDGVTIGSGSVIAAGTLLTRSIPPNSIVIDRRNKSIQDRSTR